MIGAETNGSLDGAGLVASDQDGAVGKIDAADEDHQVVGVVVVEGMAMGAATFVALVFKDGGLFE